jgi:hypothetical protein
MLLECTTPLPTLRWSAVCELVKQGKHLIMTTISQGAPHDSPSNKIEHYWSFATKRLGGLVIDPCASGDRVIPSKVPGVDEATKLAKTKEVVTNAMDVIESRLLANNELVEGAPLIIDKVLPGSHDDRAQAAHYLQLQEFIHSSLKKIQGELSCSLCLFLCLSLSLTLSRSLSLVLSLPSLPAKVITPPFLFPPASPVSKERLKELQLCMAHCDRRRHSVTFYGIVPHEVDPLAFGDAKDCEFCKDIVISPKGRVLINDLKANGGHFYSPSDDPARVGHFRTMLQERMRALAGIPGSVPDEALQLPVRPSTASGNSEGAELLAHGKCPSAGCFAFRFRNVTDAVCHEKLLHPGERANRLSDLRACTRNKSIPARPFTCAGCPAKFSSRHFLKKHTDARQSHLSDRSRVIAANTEERTARSKRGLGPARRYTFVCLLCLTPHAPPPHTHTLSVSLLSLASPHTSRV